ncbi:polysaccharide deacetylase family protein [Myroides sp. M-43]|uniref:polysaccharide deacetylase family protein n=1 Tax=Myroides oncorhynchi TaxID=2893756 RepID=UPI001E5FF7C2|nr:polysaccharide deacetylase family protein [Myroides oncorhynchi]MCC9041251.1 polysaccharide deacetylase family protein [Myroides oncorhynchi]
MARLPILMYHNVTDDDAKVERLTIHQLLLEEQFKYLVSKKYKTHHLSDLRNTKSLSGKNVVITFDDVTINQLEYAVPLLEKYNLKATFFVPFAYIGKTDGWNEGTVPVMSMDQLKNLSNLIELGHHSNLHRAYASLSNEEIKEDFDICFSICKENDLKVFPGVAYPYGNFPRKNPVKSSFFAELKRNGMEYGLRIGNKINSFPFKKLYEIKRIEIQGDESMFKFKMKLQFGKLF